MNKKKDERFSTVLTTIKHLLHIYMLSKNPADMEELISYLSENLVVIGTGRHEMYHSLEMFRHGLMAEREEVDSIAFEIIDEWYEVLPVTEDVCVVYGSIWIREKESVGKTVFIEMDSRFSIVCRQTADGVQICNVHQSIPYVDQADGEYYPKTISLVAEEALEKTRKLEHRVELDPMTELFNRTSIEKKITQSLQNQRGTFLIFDLDDFKTINDTLGHLVGDEVICAFARLLRETAGPDTILGRLGGDEFAAWISGEDDQIRAKQFADTLLAHIHEIGERFGIDFNCSIGMCHTATGETDFNTLYRQADHALYHAKRCAKGSACWE